MIISDTGPVLLEINTIPWFTGQSLFPLAASTAGIEFDELVERLMKI
jgi:D-alanine-D-alanine ligase-like ATP-grasp enzyme